MVYMSKDECNCETEARDVNEEGAQRLTFTVERVICEAEG